MSTPALISTLVDSMFHGPSPSPSALHMARLVLLDQLGITLGGYTLAEQDSNASAKIPVRRGFPKATSWGDLSEGFGPDIVLHNRRVADPLELTAGPECAAALVAASEIGDRTLSDLLFALSWTAQIDTALKNGARLQSRTETLGMHPPGFFAPVGATAAVAWLLGLNRDQAIGAANASICLLPVSPYVAFSRGSLAKELYGAWGQHLALTLALMADKGLAGPTSALEGELGLATALGAPRGLSAPSAEWAIESVTFKAYPCSRACHAALTALEALPSVRVDRIQSILVTTYAFAEQLSSQADPSTSSGAQMHIPTALALRLVFGSLSPVASFSQDRIADRRVVELAARIEVRSDKSDKSNGPRRRFARLRRSLDDGTIADSEALAKWGPQRRATPAEIVERSQRFASRVHQRRLIDGLLGDDERPVNKTLALALGDAQ